MGFVDQHIDIRARVEVRRHVAELVDHRYDNSAVIIQQQLIQCPDAAGMFEIAQPQGRQVLQHLIFQLVAVNHQQHGRLIRLWCLKQHLGGLDHREGLTAALGVPN